MMNSVKCSVCGSENTKVIYNGKFRYGAVGTWTDSDVPIYQCEDCGLIWHDNVFDSIKDFYESSDYRDAVQGDGSIERFYALHDGEVENRLKFTGTKIFRNKVVADIGCAAGSFLDFVGGAAKKVIAIEPSQAYRNMLEEKWGGYGIRLCERSKKRMGWQG